MTFCSPIQIRGKNNHWQMHKYYRSYAMEHKLQDYHRSGWSVAKKWHPSIVVSHHQSWSWCEKIRVALFIRSSKAISLWVLLTKSSICTYFIICVCQLQQTDKKARENIFFLQIRQTTYCIKRGFEEKSSLGIRALNLLFYI